MDSSYDINEIYADMELELIQSYQRNMSKNNDQPDDSGGINWPSWQQKKLADLAIVKKEARNIIDKKTHQAVTKAEGILVDSYMEGKETANRIINLYKPELITDLDPGVSFNKTDRRKLDAILDAVNNDFNTASSLSLRLVEDQYRQIVFKSQVAYGTGSQTLTQAVDIASKDFLSKGINSITYSNGAKVNIASYAEMAIRTSSKRSLLTGEGARNNELGVHLVQITQYGACSDLCLPWQGRVYIDDMYSGGEDDGSYPLLSQAMGNGLFHPNCRHTSQPFFEDISQDLLPLPDVDSIRANYQAEQTQRGIERDIRRYKRIEAGSVDPANKAAAAIKVKQAQANMRAHLKQNPQLSRKSSREQI